MRRTATQENNSLDSIFNIRYDVPEILNKDKYKKLFKCTFNAKQRRNRCSNRDT